MLIQIKDPTNDKLETDLDKIIEGIKTALANHNRNEFVYDSDFYLKVQMTAEEIAKVHEALKTDRRYVSVYWEERVDAWVVEIIDADIHRYGEQRLRELGLLPGDSEVDNEEVD